MIRIYRRTTEDVSYYLLDNANELDGIRQGPAGRWLRGRGAITASSVSHVLTPTARSTVTGYDIVVAAPRPISILVAIDPAAAPRVLEAHQAATAAAISYLEDRAVVVRTQRGGQSYADAAQWQHIVAFTHGVNRHGEPHLHDHVLVGAKPVGSSTVLDARALHRHLLSADALYRAALRALIGRATEWQPWRSFHGVEHVRGLDEGFRALWGGHFDDRPTKVHWQRCEIVTKWSGDVERFSPVAVIAMPRGIPNEIVQHRFAKEVQGIERIRRCDLVRALCEAAPLGATPETIGAAIDATYPEVEHARGLDDVWLTPHQVLGRWRTRMRELERPMVVVPTRAPLMRSG